MTFTYTEQRNTEQPTPTWYAMSGEQRQGHISGFPTSPTRVSADVFDGQDDVNECIENFDNDFAEEMTESVMKSLQRFPELANNPMIRSNIMHDIRKDFDKSKVLQMRRSKASDVPLPPPIEMPRALSVDSGTQCEQKMYNHALVWTDISMHDIGMVMKINIIIRIRFRKVLRVHGIIELKRSSPIFAQKLLSPKARKISVTYP